MSPAPASAPIDITQLPGYDPATDIYNAPQVGQSIPGIPLPRPRPSYLESTPDWQPPVAAKGKESTGKSYLEIAPDWEPKPLPPEIGTGEALGRGFADTATYGLSPAIQGALQAGQRSDESEGAFSELRNVIRGLYNLVEGDPETVKAYQQSRDEARQRNEEAFQQHPIAYGGGALAGGLVSPTPLKLGPANFLGRVARGAAAGGIGGGLYGAGSAVSKGESLGEAIPEVAGSAAVGSLFGGALHGALGPRVRPASSPGQAAARAAEELGAPIPKGLASDNTAINAATAKLRSLPVIGSRVSDLVDKTQQAAGERVAQIAAGNRGVAPDRALAGSTLRPALRDYQEANKQTISNAYDLLSRASDTTKFAQRIATGKAIETVLRRRRGARLANPQAGLEDVLNILYGGKGGTFGGGISFKGLQEARSLLAEKLAFPEQHPGFRIGEGRLIYAAMSQDMEDAIRRYAKIDPDRAVALLKQAHKVAAEMIERNKAAQSVLNIANDESLVGSLINKAQEKSGNLRMLQDLKSTMPAQDFEHITGTLLSELGKGAGGEFSLRHFVTGFDKISDGAKQVLFSPQHLESLNKIFGLGQQIKGALKESNTSHTAGVLVAFDLARDAIMLGAAIGTGAVAGGSMALSAAAATPGIVLAHWLASPSKAASLARWVTAYRAMTLGVPIPARRAVFNIATRNLANTLGVPAEVILRRALDGEQGREAISQASSPAAVSAKSQSRFSPQIPIR